jgi:hypothetical protein
LTMCEMSPYRSGYFSGWSMVSRTESFVSTLLFRLYSSSRTSPSRLPRIFVELMPPAQDVQGLALNTSRAVA